LGAVVDRDEKVKRSRSQKHFPMKAYRSTVRRRRPSNISVSKNFQVRRLFERPANRQSLGLAATVTEYYWKQIMAATAADVWLSKRSRAKWNWRAVAARETGAILKSFPRWHCTSVSLVFPCYKVITKSSSGDEIANVNFLTKISYTYYKIQ